jgi:hypothetical protein
MLLVDENDTVEVVVRYEQRASGLVFYGEGDNPEGVELHEEKFVFRRPNWDDWKAINTDIVSVSDGKSSINLHKFIDQRMKSLLKSWTLKKGDGTPLPASPESIGKLKPALVTYLNRRLEEKLTPAENEPLAGS